MKGRFFQRGGAWVAGQFLFPFPIVILGLTCRAASKSFPIFLCGLALLMASAICGVCGVAALGRNQTPFPKPSATGQLVQHGIYSLMRHPLYLAVICGALGWSLIRQSWPALAVSLAMALFLDGKARREERWLRQQFPDYANYARRVRRFIPGIY